MKFVNTVSIQAPRQAVWDYLSDFPQAAGCLPGVEESVKPLDGGGYEGTMKIRIGPIGMSLSGTVSLEMDESEGRWSMKAQARDRRVGAGLSATIEAALSESTPETSELVVSADVQFMGRLGGLGQPLIKRKANSTIEEFAQNLGHAVSQRE